MKNLFFWGLLFFTLIAKGQSRYTVSTSVNVGVSKINGDDIASKFKWGPSFSIGIQSYKSQSLLSPIFGLQYSNKSTSNKFNDFRFNLQYLQGNIGIRYSIANDAFFVTTEGYVSYLLHSQIKSIDSRKSSDVDTYLNQYDSGIAFRIGRFVLSGTNKFYKKMYFLLSYEYSILNILNRYSMHLSSQGKWLRNNSLQFGVQIELK